jgi:hypothetical protein
MSWKPWYSWIAWISLGTVIVGVFIEPQSAPARAALFALLLMAVAILSLQDDQQSQDCDQSLSDNTPT